MAEGPIWIYLEYQGSDPERVARQDTLGDVIRWVEIKVRHAHTELPDTRPPLEKHIKIRDCDWAMTVRHVPYIGVPKRINATGVPTLLLEYETDTSSYTMFAHLGEWLGYNGKYPWYTQTATIAYAQHVSRDILRDVLRRLQLL